MRKIDELLALFHGTGCIAKSADDEPIFILVGRDVFAGDLVREWADKLEGSAQRRGELTKDRQRKISEARSLALEMDAWQPKKLPD